MSPLLALLLACSGGESGPATPDGPAPRLTCPAGATYVHDEATREHRCEVAGRPDGPVLQLHEDGAPAMRGTYTSGKKTGTWTWLSPEGTTIKTGDYVGGREQGQWTEFHASGRKALEGAYQTGMKVGSWVHYEDADGSPIAKVEQWKNGQLVDDAEARAALATLAWIQGWFTTEDMKTWWRWIPYPGGIDGKLVEHKRSPTRVEQSMRIVYDEGRLHYHVRSAVDLKAKEDGTLHRVPSAVETILDLDDMTPDTVVWEGSPEAWPAQIKWEKADSVLTVTWSGNDGGQPRIEVREIRLDMDLRDLREGKAAEYETERQRLEKSP